MIRSFPFVVLGDIINPGIDGKKWMIALIGMYSWALAVDQHELCKTSTALKLNRYIPVLSLILLATLKDVPEHQRLILF